MQNVFKFYNFGPNISKWLSMLSTNRQACIIIEGAETTEFFDLERGNAQGDTISPFLFNLGYQILLYKLELSFQIEGILSDAVNARMDPGRDGLPHPPPQLEVGHPDPRAFALADDCTLLVKPDKRNLRNIISILGDYEAISGLGCNLEKTTVMLIGDNRRVPDFIQELSFTAKDELTLLGAIINKNGFSASNNGKKIVGKMRKQVNFWKRFNLSLPGRISIAKTFLYSQVLV